MTTPFPSPTGFYKALNLDLSSSHSGKGEWQVGVERTVEGELRGCQNGFHAVTLEQLPHWLGPAIHPVLAVSDERDEGWRKWVFRSMTIGPAYPNWNERSQRHFAADCADLAMREVERMYFWRDERCDEAVRVARLYADGEVEEEALAAAREEALAAVKSAAPSAAGWAARSAADSAMSVALEAALEASSSAAESAEDLAKYSAIGPTMAFPAKWAMLAEQGERLGLYLSGELPK